MTAARTSQVVVEVIETNEQVATRLSQIVVEVLRPDATPGPAPLESVPIQVFISC